MIEEKLTIVLVGGLAMRASDFSSLVGSLALGVQNRSESI